MTTLVWPLIVLPAAGAAILLLAVTGAILASVLI